MLPDLRPRIGGPNQPEGVGQARDFAPCPRNSRHDRVLVVDDESLVRWSVAETLRAGGFEIAEAADASSAFAALLSPDRRISAVLLDVYLPDAHDLRVLKALRQMAPDTPVILMTAHGSRELSAEAIRLGAFVVLDKPFELDTLAPVVERAIATGIPMIPRASSLY